MDIIPWDKPETDLFNVGRIIALDQALEALRSDDMPKLAGVKIAILAVDNLRASLSQTALMRAVAIAQKAGADLSTHSLSISGAGVTLIPLDLVELAQS